MSVQYYRLCPLGHKVICPNSLVRPPCRICGQRVDNLSPLRRMDEEVEETAVLQQEQTAAPEKTIQEPDAGSVDGTRRRRSAEQNVQSDPEPVVTEGRRRRVTAETVEPEAASAAEGRRRRTAGGAVQSFEAAAVTNTEQDAPAGAVRLDLFGMTITIPAEGGFLGRDSIGAQQLEGYLLVSRQHVYVKPDRGGRLMAEDRGSTNGTWYTHGGSRQRLELGRTVILESGDILWLYNIPLKVVTEHV